MNKQSNVERMQFKVPVELAGQRIDNFLLRELKSVPKSLLYRLLRQGAVRLNGKRIKQAQHRLEGNDELTLPALQTRESAEVSKASVSLQTQLKQSVLFENDDYLILNKPSGLAVHGGSGQNIGLIEAVRQVFDHAERWELGHRLDRDTSGCIVLAKNRQALLHFHELLRQDRAVKKTYDVLVHGKWPKQVNKVNVPLKKVHHAQGHLVKVDKSGKDSCTTFTIKQKLKAATWLAASLYTGRTHQIRVHCQHVGCPILGDKKYSAVRDVQKQLGVSLDRMMLHAGRVKFTDQKGNIIEAVAEPGEHWMALVAKVN